MWKCRDDGHRKRFVKNRRRLGSRAIMVSSLDRMRVRRLREKRFMKARSISSPNDERFVQARASSSRVDEKTRCLPIPLGIVHTTTRSRTAIAIAPRGAWAGGHIPGRVSLVVIGTSTEGPRHHCAFVLPRFDLDFPVRSSFVQTCHRLHR